MKTKRSIKYGVGILMFFLSLGVLSHTLAAQTNQKSEIRNDIDVNITIDTNTTESDLAEITEMMTENDIECEFSDIDRNDKGELLSITIKLNDGDEQTVVSSMTNNMGIGETTFGRKDGKLYIESGHGIGNNFAFFNMPNIQSFQFDNDSIMKRHFKGFSNMPGLMSDLNFEDFFDNEDDLWFGKFDKGSLKELMESMRDRFGNYENKSLGKKFQFYDDPNLEKLILIDGKESDFDTLDGLAKDDRIEEVDYLKAETATSIYGSKAKDGAIIVITKKNRL